MTTLVATDVYTTIGGQTMCVLPDGNHVDLTAALQREGLVLRAERWKLPAQQRKMEPGEWG